LWLSALALGFAAWRALYLREERDLEGAEAFLEEERAVWRKRAWGLGVALVLSAPLALSLSYLGPLKGLLSLTTLTLGGALALG
ncbi:hypothetical protein, partial [Klebsiella pneumoniae]|uniref:hypothetical protein n=1 Tax=Klebsiella pneumoniae TaxID=573 RepID=UPI003B59EAEB